MTEAYRCAYARDRKCTDPNGKRMNRDLKVKKMNFYSTSKKRHFENDRKDKKEGKGRSEQSAEESPEIALLLAYCESF